MQDLALAAVEAAAAAAAKPVPGPVKRAVQAAKVALAEWVLSPWRASDEY